MPIPVREPVWAALFDLERRIRRIERATPPADDPPPADPVPIRLPFEPIPEADEPVFLAGHRAGAR